MKLPQSSYFVALIILMSQIKVFAQNKELEVINTLNSVIRPIETLRPDSSFSDIKFLANTLDGKTIIALGEVTHGTREVFVYKDRLIRYLVSDLGYKAIGFESDFIAVQHLDDYINHIIDTLKFTGGFPLIKETKSMISWLRNFNQSKSLDNRVHLYGLETRGYHHIAKQILSVLPNLSIINKQLLTRLERLNYNILTKKDISQVKDIIPALYAETNISGVTISLYKHYIKLLEQQVSNFGQNFSSLRDQFMAENAKWIIEHPTNPKLIIWAHNGHVAKSELWKYKTMGTYLSQEYGANYYVIATDFNEGDVSVFVKEKGNMKLQSINYPGPNSNKMYEYYFKQCKFKNFFLDIKTCYDKPVLKSLLEQRLSMRMIGGTETPAYSKLSIMKSFDLVVFFNKSSAIK